MNTKTLSAYLIDERGIDPAAWRDYRWNLTEADLTEANLSRAKLFRAKVAITQLGANE